MTTSKLAWSDEDGLDAKFRADQLQYTIDYFTKRIEENNDELAVANDRHKRRHDIITSVLQKHTEPEQLGHLLSGKLSRFYPEESTDHDGLARTPQVPCQSDEPSQSTRPEDEPLGPSALNAELVESVDRRSESLGPSVRSRASSYQNPRNAGPSNKQRYHQSPSKRGSVDLGMTPMMPKRPRRVRTSGNYRDEGFVDNRDSGDEYNPTGEDEDAPSQRSACTSAAHATSRSASDAEAETTAVEIPQLTLAWADTSQQRRKSFPRLKDTIPIDRNDSQQSTRLDATVAAYSEVLRDDSQGHIVHRGPADERSILVASVSSADSSTTSLDVASPLLEPQSDFSPPFQTT